MLQQQKAVQGNEATPSNESGTLTGKERLGRKWSDEQRLDNCNVPIEKRGSQPRPSELYARADDMMRGLGKGILRLKVLC